MKNQSEFNLIKSSNEIFKKIVSFNNRDDEEAIPHSDIFIREMESTMGLPRSLIIDILRILKESHRILTFEIEKENSEQDIDKIEGYLEADPVTIRNLKQKYNILLEEIYERENGRKLLVNQIIKEIFPYMQRLKGTPVGTIANKAIMLSEFDKLMEKSYDQYTHEWKEENFDALVAQLAKEIEESKKKKVDEEVLDEKSLDKELQGKDEKNITQDDQSQGSIAAQRRAVDSEESDEVSSLTSIKAINRVLNIYGVDFFFRVNIRKNDYAIIQTVLESGVIDRKSDLLKLKDMLAKVRKNNEGKPEFVDYQQDISKLEKTLARFRLIKHL